MSAYESDVALDEFVLHRALEGLAILPERFALDCTRLDAGRTSALQTTRACDVRHHQHNFGGEVGGLGRLDQGRHVGAPARNENGDAALGHGVRSRWPS